MKKISLTQGAFAVIDNADYDKVKGYTWQLSKNQHRRYATSSVHTPMGKRKILMHHLILGVTNAVEIDHKDRDGLNNRRNNLRVATRAQNQANRPQKQNTTSKYRGVTLDRGRWRVRISKKKKYLGSFDSEIQAAIAYDVAAKIKYGEFAQLNLCRNTA